MDKKYQAHITTELDGNNYPKFYKEPDPPSKNVAPEVQQKQRKYAINFGGEIFEAFNCKILGEEPLRIENTFGFHPYSIEL